MRSTGPHKAPQSDYTVLMNTSAEFLRMLRKLEMSPIPMYVPPEIPSRDDYKLHTVDNGPGRETLSNITAIRQTEEQRLAAAVTATVAMVNAMITKDQRHNPWKQPKVGKFTIVDLGAHDCKFPLTDDAPHFFCGSPNVDGLPYCHAHARVAYRGPFLRRA